MKKFEKLSATTMIIKMMLHWTFFFTVFLTLCSLCFADVTSCVKNYSISTIYNLNNLNGPNSLNSKGNVSQNMAKENYALWLERNSKKRNSWVKNQSSKTLHTLRNSSNYQVIKDAVLYTNSQVKEISTSSSEKNSYSLKFEGIGEPQSVYLKTLSNDSDSKEIKIFDTRDLKKDGSFVLLKLFASPKDTHLILLGSDNGNIDIYNLYVYDLGQKKIVQEFKTNSQQLISWKSKNEFYFMDTDFKPGSKDTPIKLFDLKSEKTSLVHDDISMINEEFYIITKNNHSHVVTSKAEKFFIPDSIASAGQNIDKIKKITETDSYLKFSLFLKDYSTSKGKVVNVEIDKKRRKNRWTTVYESKPLQVFNNVDFKEKYFLAAYFWGPNYTSKLIDYQGKELVEILAPECCNIQDIKLDGGSDIVTVYLTSYFKSKIPYEYSLKEKKFINPHYNEEMTRHNGVQYKTHISWATSADGTRVPVRITHRSDLLLNSQNPAYIYAYGGFNVEGYLRAFRNKMDIFWMQNGGIIANPGARGGNEFGPKWHEAAMFENKIKTLQDIAATAHLLRSKHLSSRDFTAAEGTSNGGAMVAATGLLFSNDIGAVVSINGVQDQLRKEFLDEKFGRGWAYEYGDSTIPDMKEYLKKWSPVFQAQLQTTTPRILVVNGRQDSRVNPAHSFKLAYALEHFNQDPDRVDFLSINNSGHWLMSVEQQNTIGWISQTLKWTWLFDVMGMKARHDL